MVIQNSDPKRIEFGVLIELNIALTAIRYIDYMHSVQQVGRKGESLFNRDMFSFTVITPSKY